MLSPSASTTSVSRSWNCSSVSSGTIPLRTSCTDAPNDVVVDRRGRFMSACSASSRSCIWYSARPTHAKVLLKSLSVASSRRVYSSDCPPTSSAPRLFRLSGSPTSLTEITHTSVSSCALAPPMLAQSHARPKIVLRQRSVLLCTLACL